MPATQRSSSSSATRPSSLKFLNTDGPEEALSPTEPFPDHVTFPAATNGTYKVDQWQPRRKTGDINGASPNDRRIRQKSLSEAFQTIRHRSASVTENAHEIAEALKAPVSPRLVLLCGFWYMCSIFSNGSSKSILIAFRWPVTLTIIQFAFVCSWCIVSSWLAHTFPVIQNVVPALKHKIRPPTRELIVTTLPLTAFQIGGHIMNSDAMSRIPVSLVHTIKGLSPLFTVLAYRFVYHVHYSVPTYLSLIPLTMGVGMACSANFSADFLGLIYAFGSAILFVTQNIVSKRLFNEAARAEIEGGTYSSKVHAPTKPDKLNLLCYSSGLALLFTIPIWIWSEGITLIGLFLSTGTLPLTDRADTAVHSHTTLALEFTFNGTAHFAQSLVAFVLLSMVSPVTYSVASLIKRVFVVAFAVVWFGNPITSLQGGGILMTFLGLYLYDRTKDSGRADRKARLLQSRANDVPLLPLAAERRQPHPHGPSPLSAYPPVVPEFPQYHEPPSAPPNGVVGSGDMSQWRKNSNGSPRWLPGTKAVETWKPIDYVPARQNGVAS